MQGLDTGNTGFMLLCTSLVMLMTPGLAFFYGGLVGRKNVLAIMIQSFVSMGWTTIIWFAVGYSIARIVCEFFREPDPQLGFLWGGLTMGMLLSVPLLLTGLAFIFAALKRPPLRA